jgi:pimeloyl-ACP methyl ester carboxylesterase
VLFNPAGEFPEFPALPRYFLSIPSALRGTRPGPFDALNAVVHRVLESRFRAMSRRYGSRAQFATSRHKGDPRVLSDLLAALDHFYLEPQIVATLRSVPTVVLGAERDGVVPATQSQRLADKIEADFELVAGAGHSLPRADPVRSATAIELAIARVGGPQVGIEYTDDVETAWGCGVQGPCNDRGTTGRSEGRVRPEREGTDP